VHDGAIGLLHVADPSAIRLGDGAAMRQTLAPWRPNSDSPD
jgi:hypothetical protein